MRRQPWAELAVATAVRSTDVHVALSKLSGASIVSRSFPTAVRTLESENGGGGMVRRNIPAVLKPLRGVMARWLHRVRKDLRLSSLPSNYVDRVIKFSNCCTGARGRSSAVAASLRVAFWGGPGFSGGPDWSQHRARSSRLLTPHRRRWLTRRYLCCGSAEED